MLLTIITINYNDKIGLEYTINSVRDQDASGYEHIIIDGDSNDGSKEVIAKYQDNFSYWVSERDNGVYNAMNKGLARANGKYVYFLNSRDVFHSSDSLEKLKKIACGDLDILYADVILKYAEKTEIKRYPEKLRFGFLYDDTICHQSTIIKKNLFDRVGYFNEDYNIVADWDFLMKAIFLHNASYKKLNFVFSEYDMSGLSSEAQFKASSLEDRRKIISSHFSGFVDDYLELKKNRYLVSQLRDKVGDIFFEMMRKPLFVKSLKVFTRNFSILSRLKKNDS